MPPGRHTRAHTPPGQTPPWADTPLDRHPTHIPCVLHAGIRSTNGWYASHWNAFLLLLYCWKIKLFRPRRITVRLTFHTGVSHIKDVTLGAYSYLFINLPPASFNPRVSHCAINNTRPSVMASKEKVIYQSWNTIKLVLFSVTNKTN